MSFATRMSVSTFRPCPTTSLRAPVRVSRSARIGRVPLQVQAITVWQLEPQGKSADKLGGPLDLTGAIGDKEVANVKSGGKGDFDLKGLESEGLELEFRSDGPAKNIDAPADLYLKDVGSKAEIKLDGKPLEKNKEYKLNVGQVLEVGSNASYKILRDSRAHA